jgi:hypothetical protein
MKPSFAVPVMRAISLLCLLSGAAGLGLLDGQVFTHAVTDIISVLSPFFAVGGLPCWTHCIVGRGELWQVLD